MAEVIIVKSEQEAGELYGRCVADLIKAKPDAVLGLATGSSRWRRTGRSRQSSGTRESTYPGCAVSRSTSTLACR